MRVTPASSAVDDAIRRAKHGRDRCHSFHEDAGARGEGGGRFVFFALKRSGASRAALDMRCAQKYIKTIKKRVPNVQASGGAAPPSLVVDVTAYKKTNRSFILLVY